MRTDASYGGKKFEATPTKRGLVPLKVFFFKISAEFPHLLYMGVPLTGSTSNRYPGVFISPINLPSENADTLVLFVFCSFYKALPSAVWSCN